MKLNDCLARRQHRDSRRQFRSLLFDPTNPANLPEQKFDGEVDVLAINADAGTRFAEDWGLTFRYRYYDYDNQSGRIEFPGYTRFHAVWEDIPRVSVPYSYSKDDIGAELTWDMSTTTNWSLSFNRQSWDREHREVESSDDDTIRLAFDTQPWQKLKLRASYEIGDRSISHYDIEAAEATFLEPSTPNNQPGLRRFDEAAREYDLWRASAQWFPSDVLSVFFEVSGRKDDYTESEFGLLSDEIMSYNVELGWTPAEGQNLTSSAASPTARYSRRRASWRYTSTNPSIPGAGDLDEVLDTWGLGWSQAFGAEVELRPAGQLVNDDGKGDFRGRAACRCPPRRRPAARTAAQDIPIYEDVELFAAKWKLEYKMTDAAGVGFPSLRGLRTVDSFISEGQPFYLPGRC
jgi:hypothetical protein